MHKDKNLQKLFRNKGSYVASRSFMKLQNHVQMSAEWASTAQTWPAFPVCPDCQADDPSYVPQVHYQHSRGPAKVSFQASELSSTWTWGSSLALAFSWPGTELMTLYVGLLIPFMSSLLASSTASGGGFFLNLTTPPCSKVKGPTWLVPFLISGSRSAGFGRRRYSTKLTATTITMIRSVMMGMTMATVPPPS